MAGKAGLKTTKPIPIGIKQLDGLLGGGVSRGSVILLIGPTGTGKTYMCHQFIREGLRRGESCMYISTLLDPRGIREQALRCIDLEYKAYEKKGVLRIVDLHSQWTTEWFPKLNLEPYEYRARPLDLKEVLKVIGKARAELGTKGRGVFHTFSSLFSVADKVRDILKVAHMLKAHCRRNRVIGLCVIDKGAQEGWVEEYMKALGDYVIETRAVEESLQLHILRAPVKHDRVWYPFEIREEGIKLIIP